MSLSTSNTCPCCSGQAYSACCEPIIANPCSAQTPEQLMRSRYTAYTQANIAYIKATMCGNALQGFSVADAARWADRVTWRRLVVHSHRPLKKVGYVEFSAFYDEAGKEQELYERSAFKKVTGQWYYVGRQKPQ